MKLDKQVYIAPEMTIVKLDNEISLVLQSDPFPNRPPGGPGEVHNSIQSSDYFNNDPYKNA